MYPVSLRDRIHLVGGHNKFHKNKWHNRVLSSCRLLCGIVTGA